MISYDEAVKAILNNTHRLEIINIPLINLTGYILAEEIISEENIPPFRNSAVDGYALRSEDVKLASENNPVTLKLIGKIKAGEIFNYKLKEKEAVKVMTGSYVPEGADAVCMKENAEELGNEVKIYKSVKFEENIRGEGEEIKKGEIVAKAGSILIPPLIGLIAKTGHSKVKVFRKPKVGIVVTGDELISPGRKLIKGKIWDANSYSLISALNYDNFKCVYWSRVKDEYEKIKEKINTALKYSDCLIVSGGMSVGETDLIKNIFEELGIKEIFWKVKIKPGKPLYFGIKENKIIFGLPGNPASVLVCYYEFVRPALLKMMGWNEIFLNKTKAVLLEDIKTKGDRVEFIRGKLIKKEKFYVQKTGKQESHLLSTFANSDCLIFIKGDKEIYKAGEEVEVHIFPWFKI